MTERYEYATIRFYESELEGIAMDLLASDKPGMGYTYTPPADLHREVDETLLVDDLNEYLLRRYPDLSDSELKRIEAKVRSTQNTPYETNRAFINLLSNGFDLTRDDPSKDDIHIELADFDNVDKNVFRVTNQFEVKQKQLRIPDAIIFLNGLPVVLFEFKNPANDIADTYAAYRQVHDRYMRDIPRLLSYNAFVVLSDGINSKYGSAFAPYKFFNTWTRVNQEDEDKSGVDSFYAMVEGLLSKERLLALIHDFIFFPDDLQQDDETKIVARPPQFFAANKLHTSVKEHMKPYGDGKGGTYFGTTGCGKSYTMLFLSRMLMRDPDLKSPTILLITDRTDLDDQLSEQFTSAKEFIGDADITQIESREELKSLLTNRESGGVFLTTIQKFTEDLSLLSDRSNIICISDEAHRSQTNIDEQTKVTDKGVFKKYGFARYLHDSLPNATYVGFTGTPIDDTLNVFGDIVDDYTMLESVRDGFTVNLIYEGRAAKVNLDSARVRDIERYYEECEEQGANPHQIEESKKASTHLEVVLGDSDRLDAVAQDFVKHYETRLEEGSTVLGKAMFVCAKREIAYDLYNKIIALKPEWAIAEKGNTEGLSKKEADALKPIERIKLIMTRGKDDKKEMYDMLGSDDDRKELARQFKNDRSNFKIAIVVDMWLTGFDVPSLDAIYIDKPIQKHSLIQAVSRVNRVYDGKARGLIVDYIGIKKYLNEAVKRYTNYKGDGFDGVEKAASIVRDRLELINGIFRNFDPAPFFEGNPRERLDCLNRAAEYVQQDKETEDRFMRLARDMRQAYGLCAASELLTREEHAYVDFYVAVRSVVFKLNKGDAPDTAEMNERVRELLEEAIKSTGVEEIYIQGNDASRVSEDLFDDAYLQRIEKMELPNLKIKLLQQLLKRSIDAYKKVNRLKAVDFSKRLKDIVELYNDRSKDEGDLSDFLDDVTNQLIDLLDDLKEDRTSFEELGIDYEEKAFYDILDAGRKKYGFEYPDDKMIELARKVKEIVADKSRYTDWSKRDDIKASMKVDLIILLDENGYPPEPQDEVFRDVIEQAENFKKYAA